MSVRQLHLNAFLMGVGHHEAAWRHPRTDPRAIEDVAHFQNLARIAERGTFDSVFLADGVQIMGDVRHSIAHRFEPLTLLTALAHVTDHIGLIATASTGFSEPYNLARLFASLDHISGGRAGWNIVTTAGDRAAQNFNKDVNTEHAVRYQRADEFLDVVTALWDSWEDDALVVDRESGVYADDTKVHEINHKGRFFAVRGPLNAVRAPQGHPLLVQAGSSEDGKAFAATWAEAVFTAQQTHDEATAFYADLKRRVVAQGRPADGVKVLPGIVPVLGGTEAEARVLEDELTDLIIPTRALRQLTEMIGIDLTGHPRRAAARTAPGQPRERRQEPLRTGPRPGHPRQPHAPAAPRPPRRRPWPPGGRGHARADRGPHRTLVHHRRRRRVQRDGAAVAVRTGGIRGPRRSFVTGARSFP
ncbi:hypothetical protein GCM10029964_079330 [Kibdelosporangium lantanae]